MELVNTINGKYITGQYQLDKFTNKARSLKKGLDQDGKQGEKLYKACEDFEAIFTQMMFKEMRKTINKSELINGGYAEEVFQGMMDEEIAKESAKGNGSLADLLYQQLRSQL